MPPSPVHIAVVDDHALFRKGLINLILSFDSNYCISIEAENGIELLKKLEMGVQADVVILDLNMPKMDGFELARALNREHPNVKLLVVSMFSSEVTIIRMLRLGVKGYVSKDIDPQELHQAIQSVYTNKYHYTDFITGSLLNNLDYTDDAHTHSETLTDKEILFVQHACSEDTYQEIANKMFLSVKTIDGYRASVFDKLKIRSRAGLVLYGIKSGLVKIDEFQT